MSQRSTEPQGGKPRVLFLLRRLESGGAERQIVEVVKGLDKARFDVMVATFHAGGALANEVEGLPGVQLRSLDRGPYRRFRFLRSLRRLLRDYRPTVVHGNMPVANLLSLVVGRATSASVVWGIYASGSPTGTYGIPYSVAFRLEAWSSRFTDAIMVNSEAGRLDHVAAGYAGDRMVLVPSGVDAERFKPDRAARDRVRLELGIAGDTSLVGLAARLDPMKDHPTFLRAAAILKARRGKMRFVCVGAGPDDYARALRSAASDLGLAEDVIWTGLRTDMPAVYNAMDVCVLSSASGEGTPNVLLEAMSCGVPVAATDVGDAGRVVRPFTDPVAIGSPEALANEIEKAIALAAAGKGAEIRRRIAEEYSTKQLVARMDELLHRVHRFPARA